MIPLVSLTFTGFDLSPTNIGIHGIMIESRLSGRRILRTVRLIPYRIMAIMPDQKTQGFQGKYLKGNSQEIAVSIDPDDMKLMLGIAERFRTAKTYAQDNHT